MRRHRKGFCCSCHIFLARIWLLWQTVQWVLRFDLPAPSPRQHPTSRIGSTPFWPRAFSKAGSSFSPQLSCKQGWTARELILLLKFSKKKKKMNDILNINVPAFLFQAVWLWEEFCGLSEGTTSIASLSHSSGLSKLSSSGHFLPLGLTLDAISFLPSKHANLSQPCNHVLTRVLLWAELTKM